MAVAPLNKFLTLAVPVAPGEQTIYTAPVGTSAIVLYAQVSNVGIGQSYPTVTFSHRRTSVATRTAGNVRNNRIIKDAEVPPNDALILVDGRLVLERTAILSDSIVLSGIQSGIGTIMNVEYDGSTGVTNVTTLRPHGLSVGDEITMAGIAFTCSGTYGLTTSIFPAPQSSFTVTDVTSKTFKTNTGIVNNLPHVYNPSIHRFIRSDAGSITVTGGLKGPFTPTQGDYNPKTGIVTFKADDHGLLAPTSHKAGAGTTYNPLAGILTVTVDGTPNPAFQNGEYVKIENDSLSFSCNYGGSIGTAAYPRIGDPISGKFVQISGVTTNSFQIGVGTGKGNYDHTYVQDQDITNNAIITGGNYTHTWTGGNAGGVVRRSSATGYGYTVTAATYNANNGELALTLQENTLFSANDTISIKKNSLTFSCAMDNHATNHTYPREGDPISTTLGSVQGDADWSNVIACSKNGNQITMNVGSSPTVQYTPTNGSYNGETGEMTLTLSSGYNLNNSNVGLALTAVTGTTYNPSTGQLDLRINGHGLHTGDRIRFNDNSISFSCNPGSGVGTHSYPRPYDPDSRKWLPVTYIDANNIRVTVSTSSNTATHTFVSCVGGAISVASDSIKLSNESIVFTCDKDNHGSKHYYPRSTDPYYDTSISIGATTATSISLFVGKSIVNQPHKFVSGTTSGVKRARDTIKIASNSLTYKCSQDNFQTEHTYPRATDPAHNQILGVDVVGIHSYTGGTASDALTIYNSSNTIVQSNVDVTTATYDPATGNLVMTIGSHSYNNTNKVKIANGKIKFKCDKDGYATTHAYPRTTDPVAGVITNIIGTGANTITANVGKVNTFSAFVGISTAGGLVAPLQMEFICSILENSST